MISLQNIQKSYTEKDLYTDLNLRIDGGDRIGMMGGNGTGKTTLARIIIGQETADSGKVSRTKNWKIGYLAQEVEQVGSQLLHDFVEEGKPALVKARLELEKYESLIHSQNDERTQMAYAEALTHFEEAGGYVVEAEVDRILTGLGFTPGETKRAVRTLSGGWIMRAALARLLFQAPDLLILDEPTNHLDLPALTWLEGFLKDWKGAFLVISHDRTFLNNMVTSIIELEGGQLHFYAGNYDYYAEQKVQRREIAEATLKNQEQRIAQVERYIEKYKADKSRARQAGSRKKMLSMLEAEKIDRPKRQRQIKFTFPQPERGGTPAIKLQNVYKAYEETVVYEGMNFETQRGEKVALVGPNGAGKSTLLKIIAGVLPFESGDYKLGHNVTTHYFAQHQLDALNPNMTPLQEMSQLPGWDRISWLRGLLAALMLGDKEIETNIADLSGGEKAKLALAKMMLKPANLLLMDEPTNHLDPQAREVLEQALAKYTGSLIFISHDRTFINTIANRVIEVVDGHLFDYIGNYDDYLLQKAKGQYAPLPTQTKKTPVVKRAPVADKRLSKEDEKERKRLDAARRNERKKVLGAFQKELRSWEEKISVTERKITELHEEYSRQGLSSDKYAELGKESAALNQYLANLMEEWESAAERMEETRQKLDTVPVPPLGK